MKDDEFFKFTSSRKASLLYDLFIKSKKEVDKVSGPSWVGVDWAAGYGMIRGEVINRHDNVVHVRFKTVDA